MLESTLYEKNSFVTLTYDDSKMPSQMLISGSQSTAVTLTLVPKHLQDWLKRFRKAISPSRIRFFAVGEYGESSERPHFHVALFNFPTCERGRTKRFPGTNRPDWQRCCSICRLIGDTWNYGDVDLGELTPESAQYVAGYVTKKMTSKDDFRLNGRHPEFSRMSNRPGIGAGYMDAFASTLMQFDLDKTLADVPSALRHGNRLMPLGRYLKRRARVAVGRDPNTPLEVIDAIQEELRPVREAAFDASASFKEALVKAGDQKFRNLEATSKIFKKGKLL